MFLLLALACTDPAPVAVAACQALPGISAHPSDLALYEPLLTAADVEVLRHAEPTKGLAVFSPEALAELRKRTACTADEVNGAGSGRWAVKLTRTMPELKADGSAGEPVTTSFEWQVSDEQGGRVDLNLVASTIARDNAAEAIDEEDFKRFASGWRAIAHRWPDPVLVVDVAEAEALDARMAYAGKLEHSFVAAGEGLVQATVQNTGDQAVSGILVDAAFESAEGKLHSQARVGAVAPGETATYVVEIPDGAEGNVRLRTLDLRLAE